MIAPTFNSYLTAHSGSAIMFHAKIEVCDIFVVTAHGASKSPAVSPGQHSCMSFGLLCKAAVSKLLFTERCVYSARKTIRSRNITGGGEAIQLGQTFNHSNVAFFFETPPLEFLIYHII